MFRLKQENLENSGSTSRGAVALRLVLRVLFRVLSGVLSGVLSRVFSRVLVTPITLILLKQLGGTVLPLG